MKKRGERIQEKTEVRGQEEGGERRGERIRVGEGR
jgi:hypothetical protein